MGSLISGLPPNDACGAATADSSRPRSRSPAMPPCAASTSAWMASTASALRCRSSRLGKALEEPAVAADQRLRHLARLSRRNRGAKRRDDNGAALVHGHVDLVAGFEPGQLAQRGVEDQAVGVADPGNGFEHGGMLNDVLRPVQPP